MTEICVRCHQPIQGTVFWGNTCIFCAKEEANKKALEDRIDSEKLQSQFRLVKTKMSVDKTLQRIEQSLLKTGNLIDKNSHNLQQKSDESPD